MNLLLKLQKKLNSKKQKTTNLEISNKGGLVVGYEKKRDTEHLFYLEDDVHSLILGATRCGKTRSIILQSVCLLGLTGESIVLTDPKGEIYDYTKFFLERLGYEVVALDFKNPLKSSRYNFLQPIIEAVNNGDTAKANDLVWDMTESLVGEPKGGEPIWRDGQASVIAGAIMSVIFDNKKNYKFQNLTNVYNFINYMCKSDPKGNMHLNKYIDELDDNHPAKTLFGVALIAPSKTRGSFFSSALATLRLFTNPSIYNMTNASDFNLEDTGNKKRAIFIILPDQKTTFNGLASLFVYQHYVALTENADRLGGRLNVRTNFLLDEFGNFTKIPAFSNMLTVGGGRGIRFNIVIQSFAQIEEKYGKEQAETVKDNCHCLIYLKSENPNTNAEISRRLGKYTTSSYGRSSNSSKVENTSSSMSLIARDLLTLDEVAKIARPYILVMYSGSCPAVMQMPDLSKWYFNTALGLGNKDFNTKVRFTRQNSREERSCKPFDLWGIWEHYKTDAEVTQEKEYVAEKLSKDKNTQTIQEMESREMERRMMERFKNESGGGDEDAELMDSSDYYYDDDNDDDDSDRKSSIS